MMLNVLEIVRDVEDDSDDLIIGSFQSFVTYLFCLDMMTRWWSSNQRDICSQETPRPIKNPPKNRFAAAATDSAGCHHDCILSLASAQTNQRLLISSSRDGAIKVWK